MSFDPHIQTLQSYRPAEFRIECLRCRRNAVVTRHAMLARFGSVSLQECAMQIASEKGCFLANGGQCQVRVLEVPIWTWGRLSDARDYGWTAELVCRRKMDSLKKSSGCPESTELDVLTMVAVLGENTPLTALASRCRCPRCGTASVQIYWEAPPPPKTPAPAVDAQVLQLRPHGAQLGRKKFRVVE